MHSGIIYVEFKIFENNAEDNPRTSFLDSCYLSLVISSSPVTLIIIHMLIIAIHLQLDVMISMFKVNS